jgi:predicted kinase
MSGVFNVRGKGSSVKAVLASEDDSPSLGHHLEYGAATMPQPLFERAPSKADLDKAEWQLAEAEIEVNRLRQRVRELAEDGYDTSLPATALRRLERKLQSQRAHRDSLAAELERRPRVPEPRHSS